MTGTRERFEYFHGPAQLRTVEEIEAAWQEMFDRQWYDRSKLSARDNPRADDPGSDGRRMLEARYGAENLGPYTDFEWGSIHGKRAALQWVLGGEWDEPQDT